jgi:hypothetical protein
MEERLEERMFEGSIIIKKQQKKKKKGKEVRLER